MMCSGHIKKKKLIDIELPLVFKGSLKLFFWTVSGHWMYKEVIPRQSTCIKYRLEGRAVQEH